MQRPLETFICQPSWSHTRAREAGHDGRRTSLRAASRRAALAKAHGAHFTASFTGATEAAMDDPHANCKRSSRDDDAWQLLAAVGGRKAAGRIFAPAKAVRRSLTFKRADLRGKRAMEKDSVGVYDRSGEDVGNIVEFGHVNLRVPDQLQAITFYVVGLGLTRDPHRKVGVDNAWINVGSGQFHLPTGPAQIFGVSLAW